MYSVQSCFNKNIHSLGLTIRREYGNRFHGRNGNIWFSVKPFRMAAKGVELDTECPKRPPNFLAEIAERYKYISLFPLYYTVLSLLK
ncbi:hypothetical protein NPIL_446561 [Nephila pilipes]|uniref:Uncharacterized protein n=1 Tax=Nephila pilipes TaxID=299642 RepID=A0A8X6TW08_NEPPI|nr:hypothetical protein NPIL_446561 [Nephila pilipes]